MLDQGLAEAMQRILVSPEPRFSLTAVRRRLAEEGIGTIRGKSLYIAEQDRSEMRSWLTAKGFSEHPVSLGEMSRADRLEHTPFEKAGGGQVKGRRVLIKALTGEPLLIDGQTLSLPSGSHLDIGVDDALRWHGHAAILLVENYESFNRIHETAIELPEAWANPLVLYRGDKDSDTGTAKQFLETATAPVMSFMDIDPTSLLLASRLPRYVGAIAPSPERLDALLQQPGRRTDLFHAQYAGAAAALDALPEDHPCARLWRVIKGCRAALVQEILLKEVCELRSELKGQAGQF